MPTQETIAQMHAELAEYREKANDIQDPDIRAAMQTLGESLESAIDLLAFVEVRKQTDDSATASVE